MVRNLGEPPPRRWNSADAVLLCSLLAGKPWPLTDGKRAGSAEVGALASGQETNRITVFLNFHYSSVQYSVYQGAEAWSRRAGSTALQLLPLSPEPAPQAVSVSAPVQPTRRRFPPVPDGSRPSSERDGKIWAGPARSRLIRAFFSPSG